MRSWRCCFASDVVATGSTAVAGERLLGGPQPQVLVDAAGQVPQASVEHGELVIGDAFDQVAVVRDDQQRAGPGVEEVLDRREHVGVEVVGGLVEDQHVRLGEQHDQQLQATLLAAGQVAHRSRELTLGEAEPLQQLAG